MTATGQPVPEAAESASAIGTSWGRITSAVERGLRFLAEVEQGSGEIPLNCSEYADLRVERPVRTIAGSLMAGHCLMGVPGASSLVERIVSHVLSEREEQMIWRFFGKGSGIVPDLDDTAYALALLYKAGIELPYCDYAEQLLQWRTQDGVFYTWFPEKGEQNNVDWVSNCNILYFFSLLGIRVPEVERFLNSVAAEELFVRGSPYYDTPYQFAYFLGRLHQLMSPSPFTDSAQKVADLVHARWLASEKNEADGPRSVLAEVGMLLCSRSSGHRQECTDSILRTQQEDGGWPSAVVFRHRSKEVYYGSRAVSACLALEGIRLAETVAFSRNHGSEHWRERDFDEEHRQR